MKQIHTRDLDVAVHAVQAVYCPHRLKLKRSAPSIDTTLAVSGHGACPVVRLSYGAPVTVDAGDFKDLLLIMKCVSGGGVVQQGTRMTSWHAGATMPVSPNCSTAFEFDSMFSQVTVKPDKDRLEMLCSRWLGHPLDEGIRFDLRPFSAELENAWTGALGLVESVGAVLPSASRAALEEFMLTLLLRGHPHNLTAALEKPERPAQSRLIRKAEQFIAEHADGALTVSDIAVGVGVSVRSLQAGFREWRRTTPAAYLRDVRLCKAREDLQSAAPGITVTQVALARGFVHLGRFSDYYKSRHGESPLATLTRARRKPR